MDILKVSTNNNNYSIYFRNNFNDLLEVFEDNNLLNRKVCVITDSNVEKIYLDEVYEILKVGALEIYSYTFKAGEESKNLYTVTGIYDFLLENRFDRNSIIVALGGGVTGDMGGFVAATYMRGIDFVQIPTSLLAQVDSSVGGKVGIDFNQNKNIIGAFYQPKLVYANISTIKTLSDIQFSSGMGEVIKHGLILDKEYFNYIEENKDNIKALDNEVIKNIVYTSCKIKANIVSQDEKEQGIRALLNFGHTFGHGIETLSGFKVTHGNAISMGMICSINYSIEKGFLNIEDKKRVVDLFDFFKLKNTIKDYDSNDIIKQMYLDKKTKNNILEVVYLKEIGKAETKIIFDDKELISSINI